MSIRACPRRSTPCRHRRLADLRPRLSRSSPLLDHTDHRCHRPGRRSGSRPWKSASGRVPDRTTHDDRTTVRRRLHARPASRRRRRDRRPRRSHRSSPGGPRLSSTMSSATGRSPTGVTDTVTSPGHTDHWCHRSGTSSGPDRGSPDPACTDRAPTTRHDRAPGSPTTTSESTSRSPSGSAAVASIDPDRRSSGGDAVSSPAGRSPTGVTVTVTDARSHRPPVSQTPYLNRSRP